MPPAMNPAPLASTAGMSEKEVKRAQRKAFLIRPPNQMITLIKSVFPGRDPFLYFPYPPFLKMQRPLPSNLNRVIQYNQDQLKTS